MVAPHCARDRDCMRMINRSGASLLEFACVLTLMGILAGLAAPSFSNTRNVLAVRGARSAIVAAAARTRAHAVRHGGAELRIDAPSASLRIVTRDAAIDEHLPIAADNGVRVQLEGTSATTATLVFDALGIGRVASRTISLHRGSVTAGVTFSSYGRARTW